MKRKEFFAFSQNKLFWVALFVSSMLEKYD
jgi:hypothetical protein